MGKCACVSRQGQRKKYYPKRSEEWRFFLSCLLYPCGYVLANKTSDWRTPYYLLGLNCRFTSLFGGWGKNSKKVPLYRPFLKIFPTPKIEGSNTSKLEFLQYLLLLIIGKSVKNSFAVVGINHCYFGNKAVLICFVLIRNFLFSLSNGSRQVLCGFT